jgi:hypothetical protein
MMADILPSDYEPNHPLLAKFGRDAALRRPDSAARCPDPPHKDDTAVKKIPVLVDQTIEPPQFGFSERTGRECHWDSTRLLDQLQQP